MAMWKQSYRCFIQVCASGLLLACSAVLSVVLASPGAPPGMDGSRTGMTVTGIIVNSDSRSALIKIGSGREKIFVQGQAIQEGVYLDDVQDNYVILSVRGKKERLELEKSSSASDRLNPNLPDGAVQEAPPVEPYNQAGAQGAAEEPVVDISEQSTRPSAIMPAINEEAPPPDRVEPAATDDAPANVVTPVEPPVPGSAGGPM